MIFDTFRDQQNGFVFGTNAAGIQYDAQVRNQGEPNVELGRELGSPDAAPPSTGWTAEFRIPLRTLRYGPPPQTWGVNFLRNIQRTPRADLLGAAAARVQPASGCRRRASCADSNLAAPRNFKLLPYVVGSANRNFAPGADTDLRRRVGCRRQVRRHAEPEPRRHLQHRLRAGRSRHAADQPDPFQPAVPREASVLPRELRALHGRARATSSICSSAGASASTRTGASSRSGAARRLSGKAAGFNVGVLNMQTEDTARPPGQQLLGRCASAGSCRAGRASARCSSTGPRTGSLAGRRLEPDVGR